MRFKLAAGLVLAAGVMLAASFNNRVDASVGHELSMAGRA